MTNNIIDKFQTECTTYFNTCLLNSPSIFTDKKTFEFFLNEYKRCTNEQINFVNYLKEQIILLNNLKSCEIAIDTFIERLKLIHEYELKQNELFEQILHELTTINPSSKEKRLQLLKQIDELIVYKTKLI